jgi:hypothetical protein
MLKLFENGFKAAMLKMSEKYDILETNVKTESLSKKQKIQVKNEVIF